MMLKVFGIDAVYHFCLLNAFKYRMRIGLKSSTSASYDLAKEKWYLKMAAVYKKPGIEGNVNVIEKNIKNTKS